MKVLIIEDEVALAKVIEEKLKKNSFTCEIASDGEEALEKLKKFKPDIVLLDLIIPKITGMEILREMKKDNETKIIPVVILSNLDDDDNIKESIKLGANDYFVKSNHPINEVIEKIKNLILKGK